MPRLFLALPVLVLTGCELWSPVPAPEHHGGMHGQHDGTHHHGGAPAPFPVGPWTATLTPTAEGLRLTATDASGEPVSPTGEVNVALTGTGQPMQRVVLRPDASGWTGTADVSSAPGHTAVVSTTIDGQTESGRVTWGDVPDAHPHDHGGDHGHDHDHTNGHGHDHPPPSASQDPP